MYSFPNLVQVCGSCPVLTVASDLYIGFSRGRSGVWYSHLLKNSVQFVVIHTVKCVGIVNKPKVDVFFWISPPFSMIQWMLAIWYLIPLPFLKPAWTSGSSQFMYWWNLSWGILSITLLVCEMSANCVVVWVFFGLAFLRDWNENWPFPVLWPLLSFPNLLAFECSTFTASSFRIWNRATRIPSPSLVLFIVMLPKVHLTSHSRLCDSNWVITPLWLSRSLRSFLYSSVYSCHLFFSSSLLLSPYCFCPLLCPSLLEMFPWYLYCSWRDR